MKLATVFQPYLSLTALALLIISALLAGCQRLESGPTAESNGECVVLLHGLGRGSWSMNRMADSLADQGYLVRNLEYDSRQHDIPYLADRVVSSGIDWCREQQPRRIHFVTHSMGGILVRFHLASQRVPDLGRVVMLSPPNQGSEVTDRLKDLWLYRWYNGPAGQQLGTTAEDIPPRLGPVDFPLGVITGNRAAFYDWWFSDVIPGEDDGKVAVDRARVAGMADFLVLPYNHTTIMQQPDVMAQTAYFLKHGRFERPQEVSAPADPATN
jgi:hypothetical protein